MAANNGGPAFPEARLVILWDPKDENWHRVLEAERPGGMSLRDWFAGQALAGFCANWKDAYDEEAVAADCCDLANALLVQLEKDNA